MTAVQDPTLQRRRLRVELRRARDAAGLKQAEVARAMDWSPSKLIRIERGDVGVSTNDLKALLSHYGIKDKTRVNGLLDLAKSTRGGSFYDQYGDVLKPGFKEYLAHEASASVIRQYDTLLISGLLQTEEYARAILEYMAGLRPDQVDKAWAVRQHRQDVHDRDDPPDMLFVMDEAVIRRKIGHGQVMRTQLERLKEQAAAEHVSLRILPFISGAHPGMLGNFIMLEFADPNLDDLVHLEDHDSITIRDDPELIGRYLDRFDQLEEVALSPEDSIAMLDDAINQMASSPDTTRPEKEVE
ncbi:MAG TPA: helix-turn-helix transcriptional regulator [Pseudonocardiaceae bacterium]|jgi:transcriptional regulator with XRE-family HTH domain